MVDSWLLRYRSDGDGQCPKTPMELAMQFRQTSGTPDTYRLLRIL